MNVYLIAATQPLPGMTHFLEKEELRWQKSGTPSPPEEIVEIAGRICYMSFGPGRQSPRTNSQYIKNLIRQEHESVLEHAVFTIAITNISRALSHQIIRHRVGFSYSQLSQQYVDETNAKFVIPEPLKSHPEAEQEWRSIVEESRRAYSRIISMLAKSQEPESGYSEKEWIRLIRSAARSVLPAATNTSIIVTGNARAWRNFLKIRGATPGDVEMLQLCQLLYSELSKNSQALFSDIKNINGLLIRQNTKKD